MEHRFPYAAKRGSTVIGIMFALALAAYSGFQLATGGVISRRRGRADLSPEFSMWVFIFLIVAAICILVWAIRKLAVGQIGVIVTPDQLSVPKSTTSKHTHTIPLADIRDVVVRDDKTIGRTLTIASGGRKAVLLQAKGFADPQTFEACHRAIEDGRRSLRA